MSHETEKPSAGQDRADAGDVDAGSLGGAMPGSTQADSRATNPAPPPADRDSPAEARGRKILSTAFVRVGPDGLLTVTLADARKLVLRDVQMRPRDYCGIAHSGTAKAGGQFCGSYADVAEARPGAA